MKDKIIKQLDLQPHPEGGFFRECSRSAGTIRHDALPPNFDGERSFYTSIYYLLAGNDVSRFHRIKSDEIWYFHAGDGLYIHTISTDGVYVKNVLTGKIENPCYQIVVPAGYWFAAEVTDKNSYCLVGCMVAPGFDFKDFEMADTEDLLKKYPEHEKVITRINR